MPNRVTPESVTAHDRISLEDSVIALVCETDPEGIVESEILRCGTGYQSIDDVVYDINNQIEDLDLDPDTVQIYARVGEYQLQ